MKQVIKERGSVYGNENSIDLLTNILETLSPTRIFILTDTNTAKYCLPYLLKRVTLLSNAKTLTFQEGEAHKTIETCSEIWNSLSQNGADRNSLLINLGGGVVTDLGGFVASTFKRGIEFINIPTSLLAMVDASVGGKNGVDLGVLKNQIGVIRNPYCVIIDVDFLNSLPKQQITSGFAEMLKHGLIHSEDYWTRVKRFPIANTSEAKELIWESIEIKNNVVEQDPEERGLRKTLNYGHTLGHAIESYFLKNQNKQALLHGEAIAVGMVLTTFISSELSAFPSTKLKEITEVILAHFPKQEFSKNDIEEIIKLLIYDKKNRNGKVLFVLLKGYGDHITDCEVPNALIHKAFDYYKNFEKNI
ncbi:3-dehydroquinate synthase [Ulvibacter antarcticus]|uniref:3-dehydroquinate synthase n=1 Tax=Ulvibacter antarcticus TaxID=442714 RepID=A0A3L9YZE4_9FLAO|nr:3-dehydroquinate synthase [Ulvibacter antarcticus]RMA64469.1 3-dehydroquinate synthase [Ulvibacter antarcticus]